MSPARAPLTAFTLSLSLAATLALAPPAGVAHADVTESETGVKFTDTVERDGKKLMIAGTGVREKGWIDVYAAALYLDPVVFKEKMKSYEGRSASDLAGDGDYFNDLIYTDMTKALVLHLVRDVGAEDMRNALDEGLRAHMTLNDQAREFIALLQDDLKEGHRLEFVWTPGWKVQMVQEGRALGEPVQSKELCAALAKIWLGSSPISESIKTGSTKWIHELFR